MSEENDTKEPEWLKPASAIIDALVTRIEVTIASHEGFKKAVNGQRNWMDGLAKYWPILAGIVAASLWFGGRMETPEAKTARIERFLRPIERQVEKMSATLERFDLQLTAHKELGGHSVMERRMQTVEDFILKQKTEGQDCDTEELEEP